MGLHLTPWLHLATWFLETLLAEQCQQIHFPSQHLSILRHCQQLRNQRLPMDTSDSEPRSVTALPIPVFKIFSTMPSWPSCHVSRLLVSTAYFAWLTASVRRSCS